MSEKFGAAISESAQILEQIPADFIGGGNEDKKNWMLEKIISENLKVCVEIGVWRGRSFVPMVVGTKMTGGHAYGIDPYTAECMNEIDAPQDVMDVLPSVIKTIDFDGVYNTLKNLLDRSYTNYTLIRKPAEQAATDLDIEIDLLHIDGNHDRDLVTIDINLYVPKVRNGGYVIMDDTNWPSVQSTLHLLEKQATRILLHDTFQIFRIER